MQWLIGRCVVWCCKMHLLVTLLQHRQVRVDCKLSGRSGVKADSGRWDSWHAHTRARTKLSKWAMPPVSCLDMITCNIPLQVWLRNLYTGTGTGVHTHPHPLPRSLGVSVIGAQDSVCL